MNRKEKKRNASRKKSKLKCNKTLQATLPGTPPVVEAKSSVATGGPLSGSGMNMVTVAVDNPPNPSVTE